MAYTIGTSHGPFTGTGSFVIAKPAGIRALVTNIPSWTGHENTSPLRYHRLGRFTLGNSHGFSESQLLEYAQQLIYPIPAIWELLAYDINDGASCTFYELVDVIDLAGKQPWDRTPLSVGQNVSTSVVGGTAQTAMWTYTVPTGRRLWLSSVRARVQRNAAATTVGLASALIYANSMNLCLATLANNIVGAEDVADAATAALILNAGQSIAGYYTNSDAGGSCTIMNSFSGFLFDA